MTDGWKYYNHALIPTSEPHQECTLPKDKRTFWKWRRGDMALLARWTSDFDCGHETEWWYVIKDTPFDISSLKAKRRYEINKGRKNFRVERIDSVVYADQMVEVTRAAYAAWPEKYRPSVDADKFKAGLENWKKNIVYGGFDAESGRLCAYSYLTEYPGHLEFSVLRACPDSERKGINAAMVAAIVEDYNDRLGKDFYINDGSRSIWHETAFQDYLEKYFEFRKAYCRLNICYRFPVGLAVKVLYPFRNKINQQSGLGSMVAGVLKMEEVTRTFL